MRQLKLPQQPNPMDQPEQSSVIGKFLQLKNLSTSELALIVLKARLNYPSDVSGKLRSLTRASEPLSFLRFRTDNLTKGDLPPTSFPVKCQLHQQHGDCNAEAKPPSLSKPELCQSLNPTPGPTPLSHLLNLSRALASVKNSMQQVPFA